MPGVDCEQAWGLIGLSEIVCSSPFLSQALLVVHGGVTTISGIFDEKLLQRGWVHAHEEDVAGQMVFRPDTLPMPPSRGRTGYEFGTGGHLTKRGPGASDRRTAVSGTWTMDPQGNVTIRIPGRPDEMLHIETLERDRLILRK